MARHFIVHVIKKITIVFLLFLTVSVLVCCGEQEKPFESSSDTNNHETDSTFAPSHVDIIGMNGILLITKDQQYLVVTQDGTPVLLKNEEDFFEDFCSGDYVMVSYETMEETWPARTAAVQLLHVDFEMDMALYKDTVKELKEEGWEFEK